MGKEPIIDGRQKGQLKGVGGVGWGGVREGEIC